MFTLAIVSDIHYASAAERQRCDFCAAAVANPLRRIGVRFYRRYLWLRDPFAHNHLLDRFIAAAKGADLVIANGDYSCDSAFVGVSDEAAYLSVFECLGKLRATFDLQAVIGDHELGKKPLGADVGGARLNSYFRLKKELGIPPFWQLSVGNYVLIGLTSTLVGWPVFESEALDSERAAWREIRESHLQEIRAAFSALKPTQRVLLFCHDPTALPFLWREPAVREKLPQVERTIIGHLHSNLILYKSRLLAGMPPINFLGHTPKRLSTALRQARCWKQFHVLLCPALAGIELLKDGGFYSLQLDPDAKQPPRFQLHRLPWKE